MSDLCEFEGCLLPADHPFHQHTPGAANHPPHLTCHPYVQYAPILDPVPTSAIGYFLANRGVNP